MKVVENALGEGLFHHVQAEVLDKGFPWYYIPTTAVLDDPNPTDDRDGSFCHLILEGNQHGPYATLFYTMALAMFDRIEEPYEQIWRMRLGFIPMTTEAYYHKAHVDFYGPHKTALFCLNGNSGPTNFYDKTYQEGDNPETMEFKKIESIEPKKNQLIIFNGLQYHSSTTPTNFERRIMLTINFS